MSRGDDTDAEAPLLTPEDAESQILLQSITRKICNKASWLQTTSMLMCLQLGWGLWLFPSDFARLGWLPAAGVLVSLVVFTMYSGFMFARLYQLVPDAVLLGDIGEKAAGPKGRTLVYIIIYSLDATRCVILHLAASQSLQHAFDDGTNSANLFYCGAAVAVIAFLLVQVRALADLSWFLLMGTACQMVALGVVITKLLLCPAEDATTELVHEADVMPALVAVMNMIFAFGGQFAFLEIMTSMKQPRLFPRAVMVCTSAMALAYAGLGAAGYWSRGKGVREIIIFSIGNDLWSRAAAGAVLVQALAQYLVNLNVWTHNLITLIWRAWAYEHGHIKCSGDHSRISWLAASGFVITYSFAISVTTPYFSALVGLVTSVTYLTCAYTIPSWFSLRLLGKRMPGWERVLCMGIIPLSVCLSCAGLVASVSAIVAAMGSGGAPAGPA